MLVYGEEDEHMLDFLLYRAGTGRESEWKENIGWKSETIGSKG